MPFVQIKMWEGRDDAKKAEIISKVSDAVAEALPCPREHVTVLLQEYPKANWGMDGKQSTELFPD